MKKIIFIVLFLFICSTAYSAAPSRTQTYTTGEVISSSEVTENEDNIFNYLQAGVQVIADGSIVNADVNASANIQSEKLNLQSVAQAVRITSAGSFENDGTTDFDGNVTFAGVTITDLGTVTTGIMTEVDINKGSIDNVIMGANGDVNIVEGTISGITLANASAHGDVYYNDGSNNVAILAPGTSGQLLQTQGSGSPIAWVNRGGTTFTESGTFSATSLTVTETLASNTTYLLIIEGAVFQGTGNHIRVNGDSSGGDYIYLTRYMDSDGAAFAERTVFSTSDNEIQLDDASNGLEGDSGGVAKFWITVRNSKTQIHWEMLAYGGATGTMGRGFGSYEGGEPTSFLFTFPGSRTGTYYLYKLNAT
jgi:hypothetical protein